MLALLVAVYLATSLHVLREAAGPPYVSDNVESYSNFVHAKNIYTRGLAKSFGLTDETYGDNPDAPVVVYTHQGNFPRLYVLLLDGLGLDTVEKQILGAWASVGLLSIVLGFLALSKLTTAGFAFLAVLVLQTNYVYAVQWHFDTFRVWHGMLLFSTLLLARFSASRTLPWRVLCATNFLVCFYFETIFALFLSLLYLSTSTLFGKRGVRDLLHAAWPLALGAFLGGGVLVLQDAAYLGWNGFLNDLYYTYRIRNYSNPEYTAQLKVLESFYRDHSVVYWYINDQDTTRLLRPAALFGTHMSFIVALLPPVLIFIVLFSAACWCLRLAMPYLGSRRLDARIEQLRWASFKAPLVMLLLLIPLTFLLKTLWSFLHPAWSVTPASAPSILTGIVGCLCAAFAVIAIATKLASGRASGYAELSFAKVLLTAVLMAIAGLACARYRGVFGREVVDLWAEMPVSTFAPLLSWLMAVVSMFPALALVLNVDRGHGTTAVKELRGIGMLLAACALSYAAVFLFSPGYIYSAYFARWSLFPAFVWLLLVAATVYALFRTGSIVGGIRLTWAGGAVGLFMLAVYGATQLWLVKALPPDHYAFLPMLGMAPYRGKSFVIDNYAAPVTTYTAEWAYYDPKFPEAELLLAADGFKVGRDLRHLWSRDQLENPAYRKPDYFLCMRPQTPVNGVILKNIRGEGLGCSRHPIAIQASAAVDEVLAHRIRDRDDTRDSWMIIELDWTYPPYLRADPASGKWLEISGQRRGGRTELKVGYHYAHQDGLPEQRSIIRVYQSPRASRCGLDHRRRVLIASSEGGGSITLAAQIRGTIVVSLTPMAANKYGAEYFSEEITLPESDREHLGHCPYHHAPTNIVNALAQIEAGYLSASWNAVDYATEYFVELRNDHGKWFLADAVKLPQLSLPFPEGEGGYEMRVLPCNGRVCGGYSRPTRIVDHARAR